MSKKGRISGVFAALAVTVSTGLVQYSQSRKPSETGIEHTGRAIWTELQWTGNKIKELGVGFYKAATESNDDVVNPHNLSIIPTTKPDDISIKPHINP